VMMPPEAITPRPVCNPGLVHERAVNVQLPILHQPQVDAWFVANTRRRSGCHLLNGLYRRRDRRFHPHTLKATSKAILPKDTLGCLRECFLFRVRGRGQPALAAMSSRMVAQVGDEDARTFTAGRLRHQVADRTGPSTATRRPASRPARATACTRPRPAHQRPLLKRERIGQRHDLVRRRDPQLLRAAGRLKALHLELVADVIVASAARRALAADDLRHRSDFGAGCQAGYAFAPPIRARRKTRAPERRR